MGRKYIIELPENTRWIQWLMEGTEDHHPYMDFKSVEDLTPYTEPDLEHVRKEAYEQGYYIGFSKYLNKSYEDGLKDAWEAVGKIYNMCSDVRHKIFKENLIRKILSIYSASEVIEKIRQYEQEQDAEIKVGDEVVGVFSDGKETRPFVFIRGGQEYYFGMYSDTEEFCRTVRLNLRKTGRHFPEIAAVLEKMRGEQK